MNEKMTYLEKQVESDEDNSEITITFIDNTRLWIEIMEYADSSMLEIVLFDEIIETIQEVTGGANYCHF
jgi:hypothetical protein